MISNPAPTAGSTFKASVRLMHPPRSKPASGGMLDVRLARVFVQLSKDRPERFAIED
jgi:hypothetical protein